MTEYHKYQAGEKHYAFVLTLAIYQSRNGYKYVLSDSDDDMYIATDYVTPSTANAIQATIDATMMDAAKCETIEDVYNILSANFYGAMFYMLPKLSPRLTDGVLLLSIAE